VAARGLRFHVATSGDDDAPLVMLLHSVPQFWWATRHQLVALGQAGYQAAAMDLRGAGASDKPPTGYALTSLARDVAGVITALGRDKAVVVGHGTGGMVAWAMVSQTPLHLNAIAPISAPHPGSRTSTRRLMVSPRAWLQTQLVRSQAFMTRRADKGLLSVAFTPETGVKWLSPQAAELYAEALRVPNAAGRAAETARLALRPVRSTAQRRQVAATRVTAHVPVLHLHGNVDHVLRASAAHEPELGGARYRYVTMDQVGHFPLEEAPRRVNALLLEWLAGLSLPRRTPLPEPAPPTPGP
jgi:pimeloyl-ACP methyl ester carboxylesterase